MAKPQIIFLALSSRNPYLVMEGKVSLQMGFLFSLITANMTGELRIHVALKLNVMGQVVFVFITPSTGRTIVSSVSPFVTTCKQNVEYTICPVQKGLKKLKESFS